MFTCKGGDCLRTSAAYTGACSKEFAGTNEEEHKGNDSGARSSSWSFVYNSRRHAEHCSCMVAGNISCVINEDNTLI